MIHLMPRRHERTRLVIRNDPDDGKSLARGSAYPLVLCEPEHLCGANVITRRWQCQNECGREQIWAQAGCFVLGVDENVRVRGGRIANVCTSPEFHQELADGAID